ncbi:MAG: hypothetical protein IPI44_02725 [Sulfuritalea sp.]|nr:hypothetical protein [Sulfuritalea sp.]
MKDGNPYWWAVRVSWALLGGAWGAWLGFGGYLRLPQNADSFATAIVLVFFSLFAWVGLFAGMASGALIGGLAETLLRRFGAGIAGAVIAATLVNVLVLWQIAGVIQAKYPGLRSEDAAKPQRERPPGMRSPAVERPVPSTTELPPRNPCANPPPAQSRERELWNSECR